MEHDPFTNEAQQPNPLKTHVISPSYHQKDHTFVPNDLQIVLYNPPKPGPEPEPEPGPKNPGPKPDRPGPGPGPGPGSGSGPWSGKVVLPSVGAYTVQCAECYKWRLIPSKRKYEEIRENVVEHPFTCRVGREWRAEITCDDPTDVDQHGTTFLWAIDKPSIAQPPLGWERELRIRGRGSLKFADVYYISPSGKKLRSLVEVRKYLIEHPEHANQGATLSRFSFQIPKPLQKNYLRKPPAQSNASSGETVQDDAKVLQIEGPCVSASKSSGFNDVTPSVKKKPRSSSKHTSSSDSMQPTRTGSNSNDF